MRAISLCIFILIAFLTSALSQPLLEENFDYGSSSGDLSTVSAGNWTAHSGSGLNPVGYEPSGIAFPGYPSISAGLASVDGGSGTREDVNRTFSGVNSGSLYASFLINVSSATSGNGDYNLHFNAGVANGRLFLKRTGSNLAFGISKRDDEETATFTDYIYTLNITYLIVIKYTFVDGTTNDDVALFVFTGTIPDDEPSPTVIHPTETTTDPSSIGAISLRQGSIGNTFVVDGIRVATSWSEAPLPVELTSFTAAVLSKGVHLTWQTATEVSNYGFKIQRRTSQSAADWAVLGFVNGNGNSSSPKSYSFTDNSLTAPGKYLYRLKQLDTDGKFEYSQTVEAEYTLPLKYGLAQNYPNPFNPSTKISFTIPKTSYVSLNVYNVLGNQTAVLFNGTAEAGITYDLFFDGSSLASGIYYYILESSEKTEVKKMILLK